MSAILIILLLLVLFGGGGGYYWSGQGRLSGAKIRAGGQ